MADLTDSELFDRLAALLPGQLDAVIAAAGVPRQHLSPNAPAATRATELMTWAGQAGSHRLALVDALQTLIEASGGEALPPTTVPRVAAALIAVAGLIVVAWIYIRPIQSEPLPPPPLDSQKISEYVKYGDKAIPPLLATLDTALKSGSPSNAPAAEAVAQTLQLIGQPAFAALADEFRKRVNRLKQDSVTPAAIQSLQFIADAAAKLGDHTGPELDAALVHYLDTVRPFDANQIIVGPMTTKAVNLLYERGLRRDISLRHLYFTRGPLQGIVFGSVDMSEATFDETQFVDCDFAGVDLRDTHMENATFGRFDQSDGELRKILESLTRARQIELAHFDDQVEQIVGCLRTHCPTVGEMLRDYRVRLRAS